MRTFMTSTDETERMAWLGRPETASVPVRTFLASIEREALRSLAVNDDSQYRPLRRTSLWLGHNTDTSWVPEHTTQHQKVQQPQIYKSSNINNFDWFWTA